MKKWNPIKKGILIVNREQQIKSVEGILERNQLVQRFILEHDNDLPTAEMVTLLARQIVDSIGIDMNETRKIIDSNCAQSAQTIAQAITKAIPITIKENK